MIEIRSASKANQKIRKENFLLATMHAHGQERTRRNRVKVAWVFWFAWGADSLSRVYYLNMDPFDALSFLTLEYACWLSKLIIMHNIETCLFIIFVTRVGKGKTNTPYTQNLGVGFPCISFYCMVTMVHPIFIKLSYEV